MNLMWSIVILASASNWMSPAHDPTLLAPAGLLFLQDALFEPLWPTRLVRLRAALVIVVLFIAVPSWRYPEVTNPIPYIHWIPIAGASIYAVLLCIAVSRKWPVRRKAEHLAVDKWVANQRRDIAKARLKNREDVTGFNIGHGPMRLKRFGDYAMIVHGIERRCDMTPITDIDIEAKGPIKEKGWTKVTYNCGRYKGKGKIIKLYLDRLKRWKADAGATHCGDEDTSSSKVGHFRVPELDMKEAYESE